MPAFSMRMSRRVDLAATVRAAVATDESEDRSMARGLMEGASLTCWQISSAAVCALSRVRAAS